MLNRFEQKEVQCTNNPPLLTLNVFYLLVTNLEGEEYDEETQNFSSDPGHSLPYSDGLWRWRNSHTSPG
jgi:hypothetical protein